MKRRSLWFVICFLLLALCAGCGNVQNPADTQNTPENLTEKKGEDTMESIVLTKQEISLLSAAYPDAERIEESRLFDHEVAGLYQLRAGIAYLEEKYPQSQLEVTAFLPANQFTRWAELTFEDGGGSAYRLTVTPTETGFDCADDYYGALLREPYDQRIAEVLAQSGYTVLAFTQFPSPAGAEIGAGTSVDQLIEMGSRLTRNTHLFTVLSDGREAAASGMQAALAAEGFYGSFTLYFAPQLTGDGAAMEANRTAWDYVTFNCFDS